MRIRITGGYTGEAEGELVEKRGADLSTTGLQLALIPDGLEPGAILSAEWKAPFSQTLHNAMRSGKTDPPDWDRDAYPTPMNWVARLSLLVTEADFTVGTYRLWCLPTDSPTAQPVMAGYDVIQLV